MLLLNFYHLQICVTVEILCHNPSAKGFKCTSLCTRGVNANMAFGLCAI